MYLSARKILVGARSSLLSQRQVEEVLCELKKFHPDIEFTVIWKETRGDLDQKSSLREMDKTDFFTREIDDDLSSGIIEVAVHSAKDLPDPLKEDLVIVALTRGQDPSDVLILKENQTLDSLPKSPRIGTSSSRREKMIRQILPHAEIIDIRGTIHQRLEMLWMDRLDGLVAPLAALIRLKMEGINYIRLKGETAPLQGRLAVVARKKDLEMKTLFASIDER